MDETDDILNEAPDGAAVFPQIPEELGVNPLLLAVLHAFVFLEGSEESVLDDVVAAEAMEYLLAYLQRVSGPDLKRMQEDFQVLASFAKAEKWPKQQIRFLQEFLKDNGIGEAE